MQIGRKALRNRVSVLLALLLMLQSIHLAAADDVAGGSGDGTAEQTLADWIAKGWLQGDGTGEVRPDEPVTRIEWITLANRAFGHSAASAFAAKDVKPGSWKHEQAAIAMRAGLLAQPANGLLRPDDAVTRLEAAIMLSRLVDPDQWAPVGELDFSHIPAYGQRAYASMYAAGLLAGLKDAAEGDYRQPVTRSEAVVMLDQALNARGIERIVDRAGAYGPIYGTKTIAGDVRLDAPGITLRNMTIEGNLTIGEGVGEGEAYLENVEVTGDTLVEGGGQNSIHFKNTVIVNIVVNKKTGEVRIVAEGRTSVKQVEVQSGAKIENGGATNGGFSNVKLSDKLPAGSKVSLLGNFDNVELDAKGVNVDVPNGSIKNLNVTGNAGGSQLNLGKDAKITDLILKSALKVSGEGQIDKATIEKGAEGATFQTKPAASTGAGAPPASPGGGSPGTPVAQLQSVAAANGSITAVMSAAPPSGLVKGQFIVRASVNGGAATIVVPSELAVDAGARAVTLTVPTIAQTDSEQSVVYSVTYRGVTMSAAPLVIAAQPQTEAVLESLAASNGTLTATLSDTPSPGLTANDFAVALSINGGTAAVVVPTAIAVDAASRTVQLTVPVIAETSHEQTLVYAVTYGGVTISATPFVIAAQPEPEPTVTALVYAPSVTVTDATYQLELSALIGGIEIDVTADATGWTSSNPAVVTVDGEGLLSKVGPAGTAIVTVQYGGLGAAYTVHVPAPYVFSRAATAANSNGTGTIENYPTLTDSTVPLRPTDNNRYMFVEFGANIDKNASGNMRISGLPGASVFGVYTPPNYLILDLGPTPMSAGTYYVTIEGVIFAGESSPQGPFLLTIIKP